MTIRFCWYKDDIEDTIFREKTKRGFKGDLSFYTTCDQSGEEESEEFKKFLEDVKQRLARKYGSEAEYQFKSAFGGLAMLTYFMRYGKRTTFSVKLEGAPLKVLKEIFPDKLVEVRVQLRGAIAKLQTRDCTCPKFYPRTECRDHFTPNALALALGAKSEDYEDISTKGMQIEDSHHKMGGFCGDDKVKIPELWRRFLRHLKNDFDYVRFYAKTKIEVRISEIEEKVEDSRAMVLSIAKTILENQVLSDVAIIAENGSEIKCHKTFLAARSPVFSAMFGNNCKEARENKIEMTEMPAEVVQAFLAYIYCGDLTLAQESCDLTFELFEAGHKYEVTSLEEDAKQILLRTPSGRFDVDVALRLVSIYGHLKGCAKLRKKALQVIKDKYDELADSEDYQQLFANDPKGALSLCKCAISL